jgi:hypothetical protein
MLPKEGLFNAMSASKHVHRRLAAVACLIALAPASPALALDIPIPTDKVAHFGVSYVMTDQLIRFGVRPEQAVGATLLAGWLKEVVDRQFDPYDFAADAAGALAAAYVRVEVKF